VLEKLKEKYGTPKALLPKRVQTRLGASINAFTAVWELSDMTVLFESVYGTLDQGWVIIDTKKGAGWRVEQMRKLLKDNRPL